MSLKVWHEFQYLSLKDDVPQRAQLRRKGQWNASQSCIGSRPPPIGELSPPILKHPHPPTFKFLRLKVDRNLAKFYLHYSFRILVLHRREMKILEESLGSGNME